MLSFYKHLINLVVHSHRHEEQTCEIGYLWSVGRTKDTTETKDGDEN